MRILRNKNRKAGSLCCFRHAWGRGCAGKGDGKRAFARHSVFYTLCRLLRALLGREKAVACEASLLSRHHVLSPSTMGTRGVPFDVGQQRLRVRLRDTSRKRMRSSASVSARGLRRGVTQARKADNVKAWCAHAVKTKSPKAGKAETSLIGMGGKRAKARAKCPAPLS